MTTIINTLKKSPAGLKSTPLPGQNTGAPKVRDSNLELYRIIVMLLIVAHHYVVNSGLTAPDGPIFTNLTSWRSIFLLLFGAWGKTGINCFVLISGYFMCKSSISLQKFLKLLFELYFYRTIITLIFWITGYSQPTPKGILGLIVPFTDLSTGFISCYLIFFLCIPFLNILVKNLTEKMHLALLMLTVGVYVIFGSIPVFTITFNYITWFIILYFIASYIRLYPKKLFENTKFWGIASLIIIAIAALSVVVCAIVPPLLFGLPSSPFIFVSDSNRIFAVCVSVSTFLFFKNLRIPSSPFINTVASTTFGVLMIHANSDAMRQFLWQDLLDNVGAYSSPLMPLHAIGSVIGVFAVCSVIDYLRIRFIERPLFSRWDRWGGKLEQKIRNALQ